MAALTNPPALTRRWARLMVCSPATEKPLLYTITEEELARGVREAVTKRLHQKAIVTISTLEEDSDSDREQIKRKKPFKSVHY